MPDAPNPVDSATNAAPTCPIFRALGRISYTEAFELQQQVHAEVLAGHAPPTILMLEHDPPVITVTRRHGPAHILSTAQDLEQDHIQVVQTDRGGDVTYHGPGQLVAYPVIPLARYGLNVRQFIRLLEQSIIDALARFDIAGRRDDAGVGIWVDGAGPAAKIAAIGVRIRRWVSLHGLAINVTTQLEHFRHIVPCGLNRPVTSLAEQLGNGCPKMSIVSDALRQVLVMRLSRCRPTAGHADPAP